MGSGGTTTARLKLEGIDGRAHQGWSLWLNLNQHGETYQDQMFFMTDSLKGFQDMIFGGAWPLVVRGLTCLALIQLTSEIIAEYLVLSVSRRLFYLGLPAFKQEEEDSNNRSVMSFRCSGLHACYNVTFNGRQLREEALLPQYVT